MKEIAERRYEAKLAGPAPKGAWRINCTMPTGGKRYRWFGMQYYSADGASPQGADQPGPALDTPG